MKELSGPQEQSALCLSCHFGTEDKQVNHRLIGAGHPRLSFELDTFQSIQPRHWAIDTDYGQRKQPYLPVRSWFVSQVVQGESSLQRLLSEKRSRQGIFPEFALFSCTACHHSLVEEQWKKREYGGQPGIPHLNLASLVMVREALAVIEPRSATQFDKSLDTLHEAYVVGGPAVSGAVTTLLQKLHQLRSASALEQVNDTATARRLLARMVEFAASKRFATYEEAEQIAMAVSTFSAAIEPDGSLHRREIDALYLELKDPKAFDPGAFQQAAARFSQAL